MTKKTCPECGKPMRYERRKDVVQYKGHKKSLQTLGWWCACGEGVLDGKALQARERAFLELRAKVEGVLSPAEVTAVRKQLGISQRTAGDLLGGGPRAFQKYERGTTAVSVPMSNLLRLLAHDPERIQELNAKTQGKKTFNDHGMVRPKRENVSLSKVGSGRAARSKAAG